MSKQQKHSGKNFQNLHHAGNLICLANICALLITVFMTLEHNSA